jgi:hypothetical protein
MSADISTPNRFSIDVPIYSYHLFESVAQKYISNVNYFKRIFGFTILTVARTWQFVEVYPWGSEEVSIRRKHLLWTLYYMKNKPKNEASAASFCKCTIPTFRKYKKLVWEVLSFTLPQV